MMLSFRGSSVAHQLAEIGKKKAIDNNKRRLSQFYDKENFTNEVKLAQMKAP